MSYLLKLFTPKYLFSSIIDGDCCWGDGISTVFSIYHCVITLNLFHSSWLRSQLIKTCSCLKFHYFQTANLALGVFPSKQKAYLFQRNHQPGSNGFENALHVDGCGCCVRWFQGDQTSLTERRCCCVLVTRSLPPLAAELPENRRRILLGLYPIHHLLI